MMLRRNRVRGSIIALMLCIVFVLSASNSAASVLHFDGQADSMANGGAVAMLDNATVAASILQQTQSGFASQLCMGFNDARTPDYFCVALQWMISNNYVSGYAGTRCTDLGITSPCFLPYDQVTRGQFAKIVVNAFQWGINTSGGPHFDDVPPGSTFYDVVETAYNRGIMSGYSGDPTYRNPCMNGSPYETSGRTYFRWCNPITRGAMAKMVSQAAGFQDSTSGRNASFHDVASGSTFFDYVERLVMHGTIAEWPPKSPPSLACGSSTLPCFYPGLNALRADATVHVFLGRNPYQGGQYFTEKSSGADPKYTGVEVAVAMSDPGPFDGVYRVAVPNGVSDLINCCYVESGPRKACSGFTCGDTHPYGSWGNAYTGVSDEFVDTTITLAGNSNYVYKTVWFGGTGGQWQSQWCGVKGCRGLRTSQDLGDSLRFVGTGLETLPIKGFTQQRATVDYGKYLMGGTWATFCWDSTLSPMGRMYTGRADPCTNGKWNVFYP